MKELDKQLTDLQDRFKEIDELISNILTGIRLEQLRKKQNVRS